MTGKRKTTASVSSVGADGKQPNLKKDTEIIANETAQINLQATNNCKSPEKSGCSLHTVSMTELYDTLYPLLFFRLKEHSICRLFFSKRSSV